jgi:hypothetical protein
MLQSYLLMPDDYQSAVDHNRRRPDALTFKEIAGDCKPKRRRRNPLAFGITL